MAEFEHVLVAGDVRETTNFRVAGRIMTQTAHGQSGPFLTFRRQAASIQCYLRKEEISAEDNIAFDLLDVGDIVGVAGLYLQNKKR